MKKSTALVLFAILATGCSTSTADLEKKTAATAQTLTYSENYQEIYRRVYTASSRCVAGNINAYASMNVDAQLYNELGYGEITGSLVNVGVRNYYWKAKIERAGQGSKMTINSGNTLGANATMKKVLSWASGDQSC
ncbi:hypothetical protein DSM25558_0183 [Agrobacterium sp. DSM 25558]|uniref:hypothetical protein n=1 Tax=Agrobacterium sp. DSM 25558 TaxID=1907665 RepID=UPI0009724F82|nr:hypothetical protein [Agrobacterium sp. DSM 25558]SCX00819.1 hypothetical protein DSM25558_0183 [Agrobacterium sp. DSM 25558]